MFVAWTPRGALIAWVLLGALIGIVAALRKGYSVPTGIVGGVLLGPLALLMVRSTALDDSDKPVLAERQPAPQYVGRRCPKCPGPNDSLVWVMAIEHPGFGDFVAPQTTFVHYYRCVVCNYDWELTSPLSDPDRPIPRRVH